MSLSRFRIFTTWAVPFYGIIAFFTFIGCGPGLVLNDDGSHSGDQGGSGLVLELPLRAGIEKMCTQGAHGTYSHSTNSTRYDIDLDTDNDSDEEIFAPVSGTVRVHMESASSGFGYHVNIDRGNGTYVVIGHLADIFVRDGDEVAAGSLLGYEGCTGYCAGDHVHIGLHQGDAGETADNGTSIPATYRAANQSDGTGVTTIGSEDFVCGIRSEGDPQDGDFYASDLAINLWHPDGTLVKTPDNARVYVLEDGKTRWIENEEVFWAMELSFNEVVLISKEELACLGSGEDIVTPIDLTQHNGLRDGTIVKESDASDVYVISGGFALPVQTWDVYLLMNYFPREILVVDGGVVSELHEVGNCVSDQMCLDFEAVTTCGGGLELSDAPGTGGEQGDDDDVATDDDDATPPLADDDDVATDDDDATDDDAVDDDDAATDDDDATPPLADDDDATPPDAEPETSTLTVEVDYPANYPQLTFTVQPVFAVSTLGQGWHPLQPSVQNDDEVSWSDTGDYSGLLGVRFNVNVDSDGDGVNDDWYCYGHYATAFLEYGVAVDINLDTDSWDENDLVTWSPGSASDTSLGCSALLWFGNTASITQGAVY